MVCGIGLVRIRLIEARSGNFKRYSWMNALSTAAFESIVMFECGVQADHYCHILGFEGLVKFSAPGGCPRQSSYGHNTWKRREPRTTRPGAEPTAAEVDPY